MEFGQQFRNFRRQLGFLYMPQSWDMGQIILLPLRKKACCGFFQLEKSDAFGRERTRDLGYQSTLKVSIYFQTYKYLYIY
jgi:hypothetical protein